MSSVGFLWQPSPLRGRQKGIARPLLYQQYESSGKKGPCDTAYSPAVTHPSTNPARPGLTSDDGWRKRIVFNFSFTSFHSPVCLLDFEFIPARRKISCHLSPYFEGRQRTKTWLPVSNHRLLPDEAVSWELLLEGRRRPHSHIFGFGITFKTSGLARSDLCLHDFSTARPNSVFRNFSSKSTNQVYHVHAITISYH